MANPLQTYQQRTTASWTRIGMLILLYDEAIERLKTALLLLNDGNTDAAARHVIRAERIVIELLDGLNLEYGEIPQSQQRLLIFVIDCLLTRDPARVQAALRVLNTMREGFEGIRGEAVELEERGEIPTLENVRLLDATAAY